MRPLDQQGGHYLKTDVLNKTKIFPDDEWFMRNVQIWQEYELIQLGLKFLCDGSNKTLLIQ